ncbi:MAG TPA: YciI family protein [Rhodospirillales bacterium]|nr:YciI family protein [Rhodospirillales bacterium]
MFFVFHCVDKPDSQQLRLDNRSAHLEHLQAFGDNVFAAGPTMSDDGETMTGSVLIMKFDDRVSAGFFAASDPYNKAGLFESVTILPWKKVLPKA